MFKKKKQKRTLDVIGKEEYNFDFQLEKNIYKNLCCIHVKKKHIRKLKQENLKFNTYSAWKKYIFNKYKNCNREQLLEFSKYLNQGIRNTEPSGKYWELVVPVIMTLVLTSFLNFFGSVKLDLSGIPIIDILVCVVIIGIFIGIIPMVLTIVLIWNTIKLMFDNHTDKIFFIDYKEIIDEMINKEKL